MLFQIQLQWSRDTSAHAVSNVSKIIEMDETASRQLMELSLFPPYTVQHALIALRIGLKHTWTLSEELTTVQQLHSGQLLTVSEDFSGQCAANVKKRTQKTRNAAWLTKKAFWRNHCPSVRLVFAVLMDILITIERTLPQWTRQTMPTKQHKLNGI